MHRTYRAIGLCWMLGALGCASERAEIPDDPRLTVGTVQREIKVGMSGAEVAAVLGSPNIVTTDAKRREEWIYDKVSTDRVEAGSGAHATLILIGARSGESSSSQRQRTLTIIIKFDEEKNVRDFSYNYTQF